MILTRDGHVRNVHDSGVRHPDRHKPGGRYLCRVDPPADFGFVVFIDLGNSTLMGLAGGDWVADSSISSYPDKVAEIFATPGQFVRGFRLERLPASGMVFRFDVLDASTVAARYRVAKKDLDYFGQSIVFPGRLESLREDLNRHLASAQMTA